MKTAVRAWRTIILSLVAAAGVIPAGEAQATNFDPRVITFGDSREQIKSMPIEKRPNRPLHVYGNSIRRRHQRTANDAPTRR